MTTIKTEQNDDPSVLVVKQQPQRGPKVGMTWSRGGGIPHRPTATTTGKASGEGRGGGRRRANYPPSWGEGQDKMKMRKRVLCVFDGQRRLCKDDMMLSADNEVRIPLPSPSPLPSENAQQNEWRDRRWITDLDILTIRRAEAFHGATVEERGPWMDGPELEKLMGVSL